MLPSELPKARGNLMGDNEQAALLGRQVFFDARFSANKNIRCASCHSPDNHFADLLAQAQGLGHVLRNTPTLLNAAWSTWQFWDGRADTVWSQPLYTFEQVNEMNFSRLEMAHALAKFYQASYTQIFGPLPDLQDTQRFPPAGKPGDAAFDHMTTADQEAINRVVANLGKALEAFMRRVASGNSPVDDYLQGNLQALTPQEVHGLEIFVQAGCIACHNGPNYSDNKFHNLGVAAWPDDPIDLGRADAMEILYQSPFKAGGHYFDGANDHLTNNNPSDTSNQLGAFKTPSLRNLIYTMPYGHNGRFATLEEVVDFHLAGGGQENIDTVGTIDPLLVKQNLLPQDKADLILFLQALVGTYRNNYLRAPNWWGWPDR